MQLKILIINKIKIKKSETSEMMDVTIRTQVWNQHIRGKDNNIADVLSRVITMLGSACNFYDGVLFKRNFTLKCSFCPSKV